MAITMEIFEDSGETGSPVQPALSQSINNVGWKDSALDETYVFVDYPIARPIPPASYSLSYWKYNYVKISGTYPAATRLQLKLSGDPEGAAHDALVDCNGGVRIYYKFSNTYSGNQNGLLSGTLYTPGSDPWFPLFTSSVNGPQDATTRINSMATDTTYYSNYFITQLYVEEGDWIDYGNIGAIQMRFTLHEYESTDF